MFSFTFFYFQDGGHDSRAARCSSIRRLPANPLTRRVRMSLLAGCVHVSFWSTMHSFFYHILAFLSSSSIQSICLFSGLHLDLLLFDHLLRWLWHLLAIAPNVPPSMTLLLLLLHWLLGTAFRRSCGHPHRCSCFGAFKSELFGLEALHRVFFNCSDFAVYEFMWHKLAFVYYY